MRSDTTSVRKYIEKQFLISCYPVTSLSVEVQLQLQALVYDLRAAHFTHDKVLRKCIQYVIDDLKINTCKLNIEAYVKQALPKQVNEEQKQRKFAQQ